MTNLEKLVFEVGFQTALLHEQEPWWRKDFLPSLSGRPSGLMQWPQGPPKAPVPLRAFPAGSPGRLSPHSLLPSPGPSVCAQTGGGQGGGQWREAGPATSVPLKKPCPDTPILPLPGPGESHTPLESKWSRKAISPSGDNLRWNRVPVRRTDIG